MERFWVNIEEKYLEKLYTNVINVNFVQFSFSLALTSNIEMQFNKSIGIFFSTPFDHKTQCCIFIWFELFIILMCIFDWIRMSQSNWAFFQRPEKFGCQYYFIQSKCFDISFFVPSHFKEKQKLQQIQPPYGEWLLVLSWFRAQFFYSVRSIHIFYTFKYDYYVLAFVSADRYFIHFSSSVHLILNSHVHSFFLRIVWFNSPMKRHTKHMFHRCERLVTWVLCSSLLYSIIVPMD